MLEMNLLRVVRVNYRLGDLWITNSVRDLSIRLLRVGKNGKSVNSIIMMECRLDTSANGIFFILKSSHKNLIVTSLQYTTPTVFEHLLLITVEYKI